MRLLLLSVAASALALASSPALAQPLPPGPQQPRHAGYDPAGRDAWLADCRQRASSRDSGGAASDRDECQAYLDDYYARYTQAGYADHAPDHHPGYAPEHPGDHPGAYPGYGHPGDGYPGQAYSPPPPPHGEGPGMAPRLRPQLRPQPQPQPMPCCGQAMPAGQPMMMQPMMMVPVMMVPVGQPQQNCTETVEYIYEDVPVRPHRAKRVYRPRPAKVIPDKRVKWVPDKRLPAGK